MTPETAALSLRERLLKHADDQIENDLDYIKIADALMREAAAALPEPAQDVTPVALPSRKVPAMSDVRPIDFFHKNVDQWGAEEWFDRLARAIREQDKCAVAQDYLNMETYRNIASSSAMRLVRDYEQQIRSALAPCKQEPVGWQWRFRQMDGTWSDWNDGKARQWQKDDGREIEERPLYSHATIAQLEAEWDRYKFNADELRKSRKRQADRYQRTISEHNKRATQAEASLAEMQRERDEAVNNWFEVCELIGIDFNSQESLVEAIEQSIADDLAARQELQSKLIECEKLRVKEWNARREAEASSDVERALNASLRAALTALRNRDEKNGSLPPKYREIIDATLNEDAAEIDLTACQKREARLREPNAQAIKMAVTEFLSHRGEQPYRVLQGGSELWETYVQAFKAALAALNKEGV